MALRSLVFLFLIILGDVIAQDAAFRLSVIHLNDFHARFDETNTESGTCVQNCIGGFSRVYSATKQLMAERPNPIFLDAGDDFQGTLWYNLFKWNVTQYFLNMLPTDAMTLGNHEFDDKVAGVVPFLQHIKAPVVISNIDDSLEPSIQGLYNKSVVVERDGKRIGIVGVMLSATNEITSTENLIFLDESESVNKEAQRLLDEENVFTVVVLSHSGYDIDQEIARKAIPGIGLIVGAHSHTLLYSGSPPLGTAAGPYPTVVKRQDGGKVLVVQASAYTKYLGNITIDYDVNGEPIYWDGNPIYLDESIPQDEQMNALLEPWKLLVDREGSRPIGETKVRLTQSNCRYEECTLGNLITDAFVYSYVPLAEEGSWTYAPLAIINAGGIRTPIEIGNITFNDLALAQPFENTVDVGELQGKYIKGFLEIAATPYYYSKGYADVNLLQLSGIRVVMDLNEPDGSRVTSLKVLCHRCDVPKYEDIDLERFYRIVVPSFMVNGGDGYSIIAENLVNHKVGEVDLDILTRYISQMSPIITGVEDRITIIGEVATRNFG